MYRTKRIDGSFPPLRSVEIKATIKKAMFKRTNVFTLTVNASFPKTAFVPLFLFSKAEDLSSAQLPAKVLPLQYR